MKSDEKKVGSNLHSILLKESVGSLFPVSSTVKFSALYKFQTLPKASDKRVTFTIQMNSLITRVLKNTECSTSSNEVNIPSIETNEKLMLLDARKFGLRHVSAKSTIATQKSISKLPVVSFNQTTSV